MTAPKTVAAYLAATPPDQRKALKALRAQIRAAAPRVTESISYGIPTFKYRDRRLIYFSAARAHCAVHMIPKEELDAAVRKGYRVGRGSIQFMPEKPLPAALIKRVVKRRMAETDAGERSY